MKKVWKWVIGIVIGLVVIALVAGAALWAVPHLTVLRTTRLPFPNAQAPGTNRGPFNFNNYNNDNDNGPRRFQGPGTMPFDGYGYGMHRMGGPGFGGMFPLMGLFSGLFTLGFIALAVLGIVWLVGWLSKPKAAPVVAAPVAPVSTRNCPKCGRAVQDDWHNCAYCGKKL